jgi:CDP-4-dehydro-6-deoxyglucose reductase, E1
MRPKAVEFAGIVHGKEEREAVLRVFDSMWHGNGYECDKLEKELAKFIGVKYAVVVNSGSSANMLALKAIAELDGWEKDKEDYSVVTSACGFPATLSPILHADVTTE